MRTPPLISHDYSVCVILVNLSIFIAPPVNVYTVGSEAIIRCILLPGGNYTWIKNGSALVNTDRARFLNNGMLLIRDVRPEDEAEYVCVGSSSQGVVAASVKLTVGGMHLCFLLLC